MTVEIVEINSCKRNMAVTIPPGEVDQEVEQIARDYARSIKVPGFRPGKVPLDIIRLRYGSDLVKEATQKIIERSLRDALAEHKLHPLAQPVVEDIENNPGSPLKFKVSFEVLPHLEIKDYKGLSVTMPSGEVREEDVDHALEDLREQHAQFVPVDAEARDGLYLTASVDGQFEDAAKPVHDEEVTLVIGHTRTNADFSENLRGARAGETRKFTVAYPADYHRENFAGKRVDYSVLVKEVKEKQLPELNDDFAKDLGSEGLEALRAKVRDELVTRARQDAEKKAREALLDQLIQRQTIEVPECMVEDELEAQAHRIASNLAYQGIDLNKTSFDWKKILQEDKPRAERSVRRTIFLDAIARQEGIEATDEEVDEELRRLSEGTGKSSAVLRAQLEKEDRIQSFRLHVRQNKALDFIYRNANISVG